MLSLLQLACALALPPLFNQAAANPFPRAAQQYAPDSLGAVASESSICSSIGIDLLRQGGNAADAVSTRLPSPQDKTDGNPARWHSLLHRRDWLLS